MMGRMKITGAVLVAVLLLSGCSGGDDEAAAPTDKALPAVSPATTCGQLLDGDEAPMTAVVDLMNKTTVPADANRARDYADELDRIHDQADDQLGPHIDVVASELRTFADTVDDLGSYDTATMVTSLTELNNVCSTVDRP